jgi:hypothetical protein
MIVKRQLGAAGPGRGRRLAADAPAELGRRLAAPGDQLGYRNRSENREVPFPAWFRWPCGRTSPAGPHPDGRTLLRTRGPALPLVALIRKFC